MQLLGLYDVDGQVREWIFVDMFHNALLLRVPSYVDVKPNGEVDISGVEGSKTVEEIAHLMGFCMFETSIGVMEIDEYNDWLKEWLPHRSAMLLYDIDIEGILSSPEHNGIREVARW